MVQDDLRRSNTINYRCLWKALFWIIANAAFGLAPLLFLLIINPVLNDHEATEEIHALLRSGVILFVCCALMGSVAIEVLMERIEFNRAGFFTINVFPFIALLVISGLYLLIILGHVDPVLFIRTSVFNITIIISTVGYCMSVKYFIYNSI